MPAAHHLCFQYLWPVHYRNGSLYPAPCLSLIHISDEACGTHYHENFIKFLTRVQEEDLAVDGAMTDVKGDRSLAPSKQADPDLFLHVVERTPDGVYVTGAKAHQTGFINSHEVLVMPTISMREGDEDYAISFAVPTDSEAVSYTHLDVYKRQAQ